MTQLYHVKYLVYVLAQSDLSDASLTLQLLRLVAGLLLLRLHGAVLCMIP